MFLAYRWYKNSKEVGKEFRIKLGHGDLYIMSEKATGCDWKYRSKLTLRHCASNINKFLIKK